MMKYSFSIFLLAAFALPAIDDYPLGPDSMPDPAAPRGKVEHFVFTNSAVFPRTHRDCWIYIPAQYDGSAPAAFMVFQDGHAYVSTNGLMRVPVVFDNLIHRGEMPVTVGLLVNPGHRGEGAPKGDGWGPRNNRSIEYDSLGDEYARFLVDELIPFVTNRFALNLSAAPNLRAIGGMSSGGICAFTVAWERPELFGKVLSHIGSFVNIRGGHVYPALIRKTERKPIRIFFQDGANDLNNAHGDWPLANQQMASALLFAGYDVRFEFGDGAHNGKHGGAILPDSLRWLWRPEMLSRKLPAEALTNVFAAQGRWEAVAEGRGSITASCSDAEGNFYFSDGSDGTLFRVTSEGSVSPWLDKAPRITGMKFGPDGRLYAASHGTIGGANERKKIIAIDPVSKRIIDIATDVQPNDLVVAKSGWIYFTDQNAGQVLMAPLSARGLSRPRVAAGGLRHPCGISLSADQRSIIVAEQGGAHVWRYAIADDGRLQWGERHMQMPLDLPGGAERKPQGMITDRESRSYITSAEGIQVFDENGCHLGTVPGPGGDCVTVAFAGKKLEWLYACAGEKVWRRKMLVQGAVFTGD
jgi:enterochelin esterase-like enzyme/sugar lactone lactonase YvrE